MDLPKRKHPRLKEYDYSQNGHYFITINALRHQKIFGTVGRGLAPAEYNIALTNIGMICEQQLFALEQRYDHLKIDKYVIMPNHIHVIMVLDDESAGASPRPTITDIVCAYKSLVTRNCNQNEGIVGRKIFQTSFHEHIIRNQASYLEIWQYIDENQQKWQEDCYFSP